MTDRAKERIMKQMRTELGKQPTTVAEWLVAKTKFPKDFTVDKEGNLVVPPIKLGDSEQILVVTPEVPATATIVNDYFTKKRESLKELEENIKYLDTIVAHNLIFDYNIKEINNNDKIKVKEKLNEWSTAKVINKKDDNIEEKDINDMILSGFSPDEIQDIIDKNTFVNLRAKMEFVNWKKI